MKFRKIVVLESKPPLKKLEKKLLLLTDSIEFYDTDPKSDEEITQRLYGCDAVILGHTSLSKSILAGLPQLRYICLDSTDYSLMDLNVLKKQEIALTNVPDYSTDSVVEFIYSQLLYYYKKLDIFSPNLDWSKRSKYLASNLSGRIMGIIGLGDIGNMVATVAKSFGMEVLYHSRHIKDVPGFEYCTLRRLLQRSDVVVVSCNLDKDTYFLLDREKLSFMKRDSVLVNMTKANIVDYNALTDLLNLGKIGAAILDVYPEEPPKKDCPILKAKNVLLTPHIAWKTGEAIEKLYHEVIKNLRSYLRGERRNRVI